MSTRLNADCQRDFGLPQATEEAWSRDDWRREFDSAGLQLVSDALLGGARQAAGAHAPASLGAAAVLRAWLSPRNLVERLRYRGLLRHYRPDSHYIEGRLFVTRRP